MTASNTTNQGRVARVATLQLQLLLLTRGFPPGPIDGRDGPQTQRAVQKSAAQERTRERAQRKLVAACLFEVSVQRRAGLFPCGLMRHEPARTEQASLKPPAHVLVHGSVDPVLLVRLAHDPSLTPARQWAAPPVCGRGPCASGR